MSYYTTENYYETISEFVLKLNYEWFLAKENKFKMEFYYNKEKERIYHIEKQISPNYNYEPEIGKEVFLDNEEIENIIDIDLRQYCSCYLPISEITYWGIWEYDNFQTQPVPSNNIDEVAYNLVKEISMLSEGLNDIVAISEFVTKTIYSIDEELKKLIKASPANDIYTGVLADFLKICSSRLYRKNEQALTVHELTRDFSDKLDFNITQEEMVSLLYILAESEILKTPTKYEYHFIPFCFKYFTVRKKSVAVRLTNEKTFTEAYRRILRDLNGNGLFKIKIKLEPILKKIIEKSK